MDLEQLISKIKSGDTEAFGLLYDLYYPKMRGICIKIVGHNGADVDDIVHDAFVLAFISLDKLKNPCKFGEWLTTITKNVSLKYIDQLKIHLIHLYYNSVYCYLHQFYCLHPYNCHIHKTN